jgi:ankyrin repeat protein
MTENRIIAMHYAAAHNNYERLYYFVSKFPEIIAELDSNGNSALHNAAMNASRRTLKLLLRTERLDPNSYNSAGYTPLHLCIMSSNVSRDDCCMYMLEHGFDEDLNVYAHGYQTHNDAGKSCLLLACEYGRTLIAKLLLTQHGMNPNIPDNAGYTCLQVACKHGYLPIVRTLIDYDAYINAPGYSGLTPLHDVCVKASQPDQPTDGQAQPHIQESLEIAKLLLDNGAYVNVYEPFNQQSPLMLACYAGLEDIVRLYLLAGAEAHSVDVNGQSVAHFAAISNNPALYFALHEADVDFDLMDYEGNTPLHTATLYNSVEFVKVLLHGLCNPSVQNKAGDQAAHIAALYNYVDILTLLAKYDEHIGRVNLRHQTPLGIAKYYGHTETIQFLEGRFTKLDDDYDDSNLGRKKKKKKSAKASPGKPGTLGDVRNSDDNNRIWWDKDIDTLYSNDWTMYVSELGERIFTNKLTGEISHLPPSVPSVQSVMQANLQNEIMLRKNVEVVRDGGYSLSKHDYLLEHAEDRAELKHYLHQIACAVRIQRLMRRKLAYMHVQQLRRWKKQTRVLARFVRNNLPRFKARRQQKKNGLILRPQAIVRGFIARRRFFKPAGICEQYTRRRFTLYFKRRLWTIWRHYKLEKMSKVALILLHMPQTAQEWQEIVWRAKKPTRLVGMYEEYLYPGTKHIRFYRHRVKHTCGFEKPKGLIVLDEQRRKMYEQMRLFGFTPQQYKLAVKLQALWRGYYIRSYFIFIEKAMIIYLNAERNYMQFPNNEAYLYNYTLYVHAVEQDYIHARSLYAKSIQKMEERGPDIPFILYAYAIFCFVTHDADYVDICALLDRARAAELYQANMEKRKLHETDIDDPNKPKVKTAEFRFGKCFDLASVGFFRYTAVSETTGKYAHTYAEHMSTHATMKLKKNPNSHTQPKATITTLDQHTLQTRSKALAWHNLAVCLFLVTNDFEGSFDAFLHAFKFDPTDKHQKANFDTMMEHFHGNDKDYLVEIVKERMQKLAARDSELDNQKRMKVEMEIKNKAAVQIQVCGLLVFCPARMVLIKHVLFVILQRVIRGFLGRVRVQNIYVAKMMDIGYEAAARQNKRRRSTVFSIGSRSSRSVPDRAMSNLMLGSAL